MNRSSPPSFLDQFAAADAWWRGAGVDCGFSDHPVDWLAKPAAPDAPKPPFQAPSAAAAPAPPPVTIGSDPGGWPTRLDDFASWWLLEPTLDAGGIAARVAPRGPAQAELLVLVPQPEACDNGILLSGPQGALLGNILAAMGLAGQDCYFASALPSHTVAADWASLHRTGLDKVLRHHLSLAAPKRAIVFGQALLPLLGHDPAQNPALFEQIPLDSGGISAMAAWDLAVLLERPKARANLWRRWLDWTKSGV